MGLPIVRCGDVLRLTLTNGYSFLQCVKEAPKTECEIIRVIPGVFKQDDQLADSIVKQKESFFIQMPVKYAIKQKYLKYIANFPVPYGSEAPRFFRTEHHIGKEFIGWYIVDSETLKLRLVKNLSKAEQKLSEWGIISIPDLVEKIESSWTPEKWK